MMKAVPVFLPDQITRGPLTLRLWRPADAPALGAAVSDNLDWLLPWMPWCQQEPLSMERRLALISDWQDAHDRGQDATYGIFLDSEVVGGTGLHQRIGPGGLEIGCWVARSVTRRNIAITTAAMLAEAALAADGIDRVEWHHAADNQRSEGVARKLGFRRVGTEHAPRIGSDAVIWRITQQEATADLRRYWADQRVRPGSPQPAGTPAAAH